MNNCLFLIRKLRRTLWMASCLILARTFGAYCYSVGGAGEPDYAVYLWRGKRWCFPTEPLDNECNQFTQR